MSMPAVLWTMPQRSLEVQLHVLIFGCWCWGPLDVLDLVPLWDEIEQIVLCSNVLSSGHRSMDTQR